MQRRVAVVVCLMMFVAVCWVRAAETGAKKASTGRLTQPWSKIESLSDEQKTRIREIHTKAKNVVWLNPEMNSVTKVRALAWYRNPQYQVYHDKTIIRGLRLAGFPE